MANLFDVMREGPEARAAVQEARRTAASAPSPALRAAAWRGVPARAEELRAESARVAVLPWAAERAQAVRRGAVARRAAAATKAAAKAAREVRGG